MISIAELIPKRIKQARLEAHLTLMQLAQRIHLSGAMSVARYESGQRKVSMDMLEHIANATGKELTWFIRKSDSDNTHDDQELRYNIAQQVQQICMNLNSTGCRRLLEFAEFLHTRYKLGDEIPSTNSTKSNPNPDTAPIAADIKNEYE